MIIIIYLLLVKINYLIIMQVGDPCFPLVGDFRIFGSPDRLAPRRFVPGPRLSSLFAKAYEGAFWLT
jgi:hypothetical protein